MSATVSRGTYVLLRLLDGAEKVVLVQPQTTVHLGKVGKIKSELLEGLVYGHAYELYERDSKLRLAPSEDVGVVSEYVPATANNQQLVDDNRAQGLSQAEIEQLKEQDLTGDDIVRRLVGSSATFTSKTEFSQAKYIKRKRAKYLKVFTVIRPSTRTLADHLYTKSPSAIMDLRFDSLAQMLHLANVRAGSRVLVIDDCKGLLVAACLERMGGQGLLVAFQHSKDSHFETVKQLNLPTEYLACLKMYDWRKTRIDPGSALTDLQAKINGLAHDDQAESSSGPNKQLADLQARLVKLEPHVALRHQLESEPFDSLLAVTRFAPVDAARIFLPLLSTSSSFAFYSQTLSGLGEAATMLRREAWAVNIQLADTWTREIQVLPGRTHPLMTTSASSGYLLTGTTVQHPQAAVNEARRKHSDHYLLDKAKPGVDIKASAQDAMETDTSPLPDPAKNDTEGGMEDDDDDGEGPQFKAARASADE